MYLQPRYCFLKKGNAGYGFNLHGEAPESEDDEYNPHRTFYHVIKSVDSDSPAELGGLKTDDRLIGVNGYYVDTKPHMEVVNLIRQGGNEAWLLVVDTPTDQHFFSELSRKPTFADAVYGEEHRRGIKVNLNEVPMNEERPVNVDVEADESEEGDNGAGSEGGNDNDSGAAEREAIREIESAVADKNISQDEDNRESDSEEENARESQLTDANKENQDEEKPTNEEHEGSRHPEQTNYEEEVNVTNGTGHSSSQGQAAVTSNGPAPVLKLDMESARAAAKGNKKAAKNGGDWKNKWQDFNRL